MADTAGAVRELGAWASELAADDVPSEVLARLGLVLLDHLGVTLAGARTPEGRALLDVSLGPGRAHLVGADRTTSVDLAAWTNATLACSLELDEGNKHARGHPAVHVFPAVLAAAADRGARGDEVVAAMLAGYEVAARAGMATELRSGLHPHGSWGALGAAAGVARVRGLDADSTAAAIDAAAGMLLAVPFASATEGNLVRNAWVGHANQAGIAAVRLAEAGWARADRTAEHTLGRLLGSLDPDVLRSDLGSRWCVTEGYFKRHASCSFTHPPIDAVLDLLADDPSLADRVDHIVVETHVLAAGLGGRDTGSRLAAMFSIPVSLAVALRHGAASPAGFDAQHLADPAVRDLAERVRVVEDEDLTARLPAERAARVTVHTTEGATLVREVPNPVGDADHHPFARADVVAKLDGLLAPGDRVRLEHIVEAIPTAPDVARALEDLP